MSPPVTPPAAMAAEVTEVRWSGRWASSKPGHISTGPRPCREGDFAGLGCVMIRPDGGCRERLAKRSGDFRKGGRGGLLILCGDACCAADLLRYPQNLWRCRGPRLRHAPISGPLAKITHGNVFRVVAPTPPTCRKARTVRLRCRRLGAAGSPELRLHFTNALPAPAVPARPRPRRAGRGTPCMAASLEVSVGEGNAGNVPFSTDRF